MSKYLSHKYDKTDIYTEKMEPIVRKLFEIADANDIPYVFGACVKVDDGGHTVARSASLIGRERTPVELVASNAILGAEGPLNQAMTAMKMSAFILNAADGGLDNDSDEDETEVSATTH